MRVGSRIHTGEQKNVQGARCGEQELLVPKQRHQAGCRGNCVVRAIFLQQRGAPRLLRSSALTLQQRASRAPALKRLHGAGEKRNTFGAECGQGTGIWRSRSRDKSKQRSEVLHLRLQHHEVIRAEWARCLSGAAPVLCSAQQVAFPKQLRRFLKRRIHACNDVRRHRSPASAQRRREADPCDRPNPRGVLAGLRRPPRSHERAAKGGSACTHRGPAAATVAQRCCAAALQRAPPPQREQAQQHARQRCARSLPRSRSRRGVWRAARTGGSAGRLGCQLSGLICASRCWASLASLTPASSPPSSLFAHAPPALPCPGGGGSLRRRWSKRCLLRRSHSSKLCRSGTSRRAASTSRMPT